MSLPVPTWVISAALVAVPLGLYTWIQTERLDAAEDNLSKTKLEHADLVTAAEKRGRAAVEADLAETKRRLTDQQEITRHVEKATSVARSDADRSRDVAQRMRAEANAQRDRADTLAGARDPTVVERCASERTARDVYASLFFDAQDEAVRLASEADRVGITGLSCEQKYDALTLKR